MRQGTIYQHLNGTIYFRSDPFSQILDQRRSCVRAWKQKAMRSCYACVCVPTDDRFSRNLVWALCYLRQPPLAKLRKSTISFVMSVCLSVCLSVRLEQLESHWTDYHEIWYFEHIWKIYREFFFLLKSDKNNGYFTWRPAHIFNILLISS